MHGGQFEEDSAEEPHVVKRLVDTFIESNQENPINNSQGVYDEHEDYNEFVDKLKLNLERQAPGLFELVQPERPQTAFERFQMEGLDRYKCQNTLYSKQDILDRIQRDWDNLAQKQRQEYEKTQTQLEEEYQQLMEEYKKLNRLPQKPSTPYNIYYQRRFHDVKAGNPSIDNNELTFRIFQEWNALDADQKEVYEVEFTMLKGKFEEEMKQYTSEANQLAIENYKKNRLSFENKQKPQRANPQAEPMEEEKSEPQVIKARDQVEEDEDPRELENILGMKTQKGKKYFLIQWEGQTPAQATWEDEKQLTKFKEFLEIFEEQYFIPMRFDEESPIIQISEDEPNQLVQNIDQEEEKADQRKNSIQKQSSEQRKSALRDSASKKSLDRTNEEKHPRFQETPSQPKKRGRKPKSDLKNEDQKAAEVPEIELEIEQQPVKRGRKPKSVDQKKPDQSNSFSKEKSRSKRVTQNKVLKDTQIQEDKQTTIKEKKPRTPRVEKLEDDVKYEPKSSRKRGQSNRLIKQEIITQTITQQSEKNINAPRKRGRPPKNQPQSLRTPVAQIPGGTRSTEPKLNTTEKQLRSNPKAVKLSIQSQKKEEPDSDSDAYPPSRLDTSSKPQKKHIALKRKDKKTMSSKRSGSRQRSRENSTKKQQQIQKNKQPKASKNKQKAQNDSYQKQSKSPNQTVTSKAVHRKQEVKEFQNLISNQRLTRGLEKAIISGLRVSSKSKDKLQVINKQQKQTKSTAKDKQQIIQSQQVNKNQHKTKVQNVKYKKQNLVKVQTKKQQIQKIKKKITKKPASSNTKNQRRSQRNK